MTMLYQPFHPEAPLHDFTATISIFTSTVCSSCVPRSAHPGSHQSTWSSRRTSLRWCCTHFRVPSRCCPETSWSPVGSRTYPATSARHPGSSTSSPCSRWCCLWERGDEYSPPPANCMLWRTPWNSISWCMNRRESSRCSGTDPCASCSTSFRSLNVWSWRCAVASRISFVRPSRAPSQPCPSLQLLSGQQWWCARLLCCVSMLGFERFDLISRREIENHCVEACLSVWERCTELRQRNSLSDGLQHVCPVVHSLHGTSQEHLRCANTCPF